MLKKKNIYHCKTEFTLETPLTILAVNFGLMNMRTSQTKFEVEKISGRLHLI